uniref:cytochrome P450 2K1-like n=1 Tax=Pristiophorus japonicus TaxID=55135 RepID=UPI00398F6D18
MALSGLLAFDITTTMLLCVLFITILLYFRTKPKTVPNYPPGPTGLPYIGNLHQLNLNKLHLSLMELSEKYGSIFSLQLGQQKTVVLMGYEVVKDALVNHADEFVGRHQSALTKIARKNNGVIMAEGESWKQMRRFTISTLRDFGMGKKSIEEKILEEASHLRDLIESFKGQPYDPTIAMNSTVANVICAIVLGKRFNYGDETFVTLIKLVNENLQLTASPLVQLFNSFPFLGYLPGSHQKLLTNIKKVQHFLKTFLEEKWRELNENDIRCFTDVFMVKQQEESGNPNTHFHENNLLMTTNDLFIAGMETTSTTLRWGLLLMVKNPDIQKKVHEEIDQVIGTERYPSLEDRKHMPYTDAVIHETQRFGNIIPLNLPHSTTVDTNFRGYFIPKGTHIIPSLTSVLYDKTQWEKPNEFNPMHFLDAEGKFVKRDAFMPFSAGRRICAGESLAKAELFLFFTALLQKFRFHAPPGATALDLTAVVGITLAPKPHKLCAALR